MTAAERFESIAEYLHYTYGARVAFKDESLLIRLIGALLFFNRSFMTDFTTTIGRTIYLPTRACSEVDGAWWEVLAHEGVHVHDYCRAPVRFVLGYLFPQCLAALALLAIGAIWWTPMIACLGFLVALAPWRAPWRTRSERRGYAMSTLCEAMNVGPWYVRSSSWRRWLRDQFTGPDYYYMDRRAGLMEDRLDDDIEDALEMLETGVLPDGYRHVKVIVDVERAA